MSINIHLEDDAMALLKSDWGNVSVCQPPLVESGRKGLNVHIPWTLKPPVEESVDPEEPDEWAYSEPMEDDS